MDKKALALGARFALSPNSLGYCGKGTAPAKFRDCIENGICDGVCEEMDKFIVLNPYLETLKAITGKDKYGYEVMEAYWLGNDELKKTKDEHYDLLLENFSKQGVPPWLTLELKGKRPKQFIPMHTFQVLHVGVGRASGSVPFNMETINNCMIRWGEVLEVKKDLLVIDLVSLEEKDDKKNLTKIKCEYPYRQEMLPGVKIDDQVAVHWMQVVKTLTEKEVENLTKWTKKILQVVRP